MLNAQKSPLEAAFSGPESVPILAVDGDAVEVPDVNAYIAATKNTESQPAVNGEPSSEGPSGTGELDDLIVWLDEMDSKL